jgi:hypothetical protein
MPTIPAIHVEVRTNIEEHCWWIDVPYILFLPRKTCYQRQGAFLCVCRAFQPCHDIRKGQRAYNPDICKCRPKAKIVKLAFSIVYRPVLASKQTFLIQLNYKHETWKQMWPNNIMWNFISTCNKKKAENQPVLFKYIFPSTHIQLMGSNGYDCCILLAQLCHKYFISIPSEDEYLHQIKEK